MQTLNPNYLPESLQLKKFSTSKECANSDIVDHDRPQRLNMKTVTDFVINADHNRDKDLEELRAFDYALAYHIIFTENLHKVANQENIQKSMYGANTNFAGQPSFFNAQPTQQQPITNNFQSSFMQPQQPQPQPQFLQGPATNTNIPFGFNAQQQPQQQLQQPPNTSMPNPWGSTNTNPIFGQPTSQPQFGQYNNPATSSTDSFFPKPLNTINFGANPQPNQPSTIAQNYPFLNMNFSAPSAASTGLNPAFNTAPSSQITATAQTQLPAASVAPVPSYPSGHLGLYNSSAYMPAPSQIHPYYYCPPPRYYPPPVADPWMGMRYSTMPPYNYASYDPSMYFARDYEMTDPSKENINLQKLLMQRQTSSALWHRYGVDPTIPIPNLRPEYKMLDSSISDKENKYRDSYIDYSSKRSPNKDTVINVIPTIAGVKDGKQQIILTIEETPENRSYIPKIFNPNSEISFTITSSKENTATKSYLASIADDSIEENVIYNSSKILNDIGSTSPRASNNLPKPLVDKNFTPNRKKSILDMDLSDYALVPKLDKKYTSDVVSSEKKRVRFRDDVDDQLSMLANTDTSIATSMGVVNNNDAESARSYRLASNINSSILHDKSALNSSLPPKFPPGSQYLPRDSDYSRRSSILPKNSGVFGGSMMFSEASLDSAPTISNAELVAKTKWTPNWIVSALCNTFKSTKQESSPHSNPKPMKLDSSLDKLYLHSVVDKSPPLIEEITKSNNKNQNRGSSCMVTLERADYYCIPSINELNDMTHDGKCIVNSFTVGKHNVGKVKFIGDIDIYGTNLDEIVFISEYEIEVYRDDHLGSQKPRVGTGLNRPAILTLFNVYPLDKENQLRKNLSDKELEEYIDNLRDKATDMGGAFIEYKLEEGGSYSFMVYHFTKYGYYPRPSRSILSPTELSTLNAKKSFDNDVGREIMLAYSHLMKNSDNKSSNNSSKLSRSEFKENYSPKESNTLSVLSSANSQHKNEQKSALRNIIIVPLINSISNKMNSAVYYDISCFMSRSRRTCLSSGKHLIFISYDSVSRQSSAKRNPLLKDDDLPSDVNIRRQFANICSWHYSSTDCPSSNYLRLTDVEKLFNNLTQFVTPNLNDTDSLPLFELNDVSKYVKSHLIGDALACKTFNLISALWCSTETYTLGVKDEAHVSQRKLFLNWIKLINTEAVKAESSEKVSKGDIFGAVLSLLSAQMIEEAINLLNDTNNSRLAMVLASVHGDESYRLTHAHQLKKWILDKTYLHMDDNFIKIYMVVSKVPYVSFENNTILHICHGFDWLRSLGMLVSYCTNPLDKIDMGFNLFLQHLELFPKIISYPNPCYITKPSIQPKYKDIHFHIIQLYCNAHESINEIFETFTYTDSPLDYSLAWHLKNVLLNIFQFSNFENISDYLTLSYSQQLEALGYWQYSILALLSFKNSTGRNYYINSILNKNISQATEDHLEFLTRINIPDQFIYKAKANFYYYSKDTEKQIEYLIKAHDFEKAHKISIKSKLPTLLFNENWTEIKEFSNIFDIRGVQNKTYFESNGQLYFDLLHILGKIEYENHENDKIEKHRLNHFIEMLKNILNMEVITDDQFLARSKIVEYCLEYLIKNDLAQDFDWSNLMHLVDPDYVSIHVTNVINALVNTN